MIIKGYICINDKELKNLKEETVFVVLTEKKAKEHKKFMKGYDAHQNILSIKIELKKQLIGGLENE